MSKEIKDLRWRGEERYGDQESNDIKFTMR